MRERLELNGRDMPNPNQKCPVCGSNQGQKIRQWGEFEILRCPGCDLEFSWPMQQGSKEWYRSVYLIRHLVPQEALAEYFVLGLASVGASCRILDVGCGEGTFLKYAAGRGHRVYGLDFSEEMIAAARKRCPKAKLFSGTLGEFLQAFPSEKFDVITAFELIEHLADPLRFLADLNKALRPGGKIIISAPNRNAWPIQHFTDHPPHHLTRWSKSSLIHLAQNAGYAVEGIAITSRLLSVHFLLTYCFTQLPFYILLKQRDKYFGKSKAVEEDIRPGGIAAYILRSWGAYIRKARNGIFWPFALLLYPLMLLFTEGGQYVLSAHPQGGR